MSMHDDLKQSLVRYCQFRHNQGFAVLLNGVWGSGKTRFVNDLAPSLTRERPGEASTSAIYVSLYGMKTVEDIDSALFQQLHPILGHKATRLGGAFLKGLSKIAIPLGGGAQLSGALGDLDVTSLFARMTGRVVIFDDFERSLIEPAAILGYINPLVEYDDCKVIIIADESQIKSDLLPEYMSRKEKTIGRTLHFEPDMQSAYMAFLRQIDTPSARKFLEEINEDMLKVFSDSKLGNLRILKQALWDFERVWVVTTPDQQAKPAVLRDLACYMCAAALELRSGRLQESQFVIVDPFRSAFARVSGKSKQDPLEIELVSNRYPNVAFENPILTPKTVADCVLRSKVVPEIVQNEIAANPAFCDPLHVPSWKALWRAQEVDAEEQERIVKRFEGDFNSRVFVGQGEIYHAIGLALWLAKMEFEKWREPDIIEEIRRFITETYEKMPMQDDDVANRNSLESWKEGYDGFGFRQADTKIFKELVHFEKETRERWRKGLYSKVAAHLQSLAFSNSERFLREICQTNYGPSTYAYVSVLRFIEVKSFAKSILAASYEVQKDILMALSIRFEYAVSAEELTEEKEWLRQLSAELKSNHHTMSKISADAFIHLERHYLDKAELDLIKAQDHFSYRTAGQFEGS